MLLDRDGFHVENTPTNNSHLEFIRKLKIVIGLTVNSNLYSKKEEKEEEVDNDEDVESEFLSFCKKDQGNSSSTDENEKTSQIKSSIKNN